jgi:hypothetical protein
VLDLGHVLDLVVLVEVMHDTAQAVSRVVAVMSRDVGTVEPADGSRAEDVQRAQGSAALAALVLVTVLHELFVVRRDVRAALAPPDLDIQPLTGSEQSSWMMAVRCSSVLPSG